MTRFIVVRHGQTHSNVATIIQGHGDSGLTQEGIAQAEAIGEREIVLDPRLRERAFGVGEGMTYEEVDRAYPGAFARVRDVDPDFVIPGGESRRQFHERVLAVFEALAREHAGKTVVVVTHGGVLSAFYRHVHGIDIGVARAIAIGNASYNVLRHEAGEWTVETWSDSAHLDGAEPFEEA